jgi:hypothetical protein
MQIVAMIGGNAEQVRAWFRQFAKNHYQATLGSGVVKLPRHKWVRAGGKAGHNLAHLLEGGVGRHLRTLFAQDESGAVIVYADDSLEIVALVWCPDLSLLGTGGFDPEGAEVLAVHDPNAKSGLRRKLTQGKNAIGSAGRKFGRGVKKEYGSMFQDVKEDPLFMPLYWVMIGPMIPFFRRRASPKSGSSARNRTNR